ncbi:serine protease [Marivivens niveibacter]|uniref:Probable periplasmic serine endoprotease DegP-like n=2 Tax=Marivivens niveibacter TaxID=1930667 RepID=A0A251WZ18_9RHOB|nr:serine protease [Marivivens niveibacter]
MKSQSVAIARDNRRETGIVMALMLSAIMVLMSALGAAAQERPTSFADLAEKISPAVVNITTTTVVSTNAGPQGMVPEGSPFEDFFRDFQNQGPRESSALGSGFVISDDGYIVTNNHVIEGADEILIEFFPGGGTPMEAELVGTDPNTDIALLKVDATDLPFVEFGDSDTARVGDWVMAMGNPLGQGFSVSAGIVSARNRSLSGTYDDYIQTDAAINRGNSGGPLFNMDGDVVGVNTAILSPNGGSIGIGFSMASNVVTKVVDQLREFGETRRGWLGVQIQDVTPDMVDGIEGLDVATGALVNAVPDGPAKDAGVMAGDVILSFDGAEIENTRELVQIVAEAPVGQEVILDILRRGETVDITVTLGRRETAQASMPGNEAPMEQEAPAAEETELLGLTLSEISKSVIAEYGLAPNATGLVVLDVAPLSDADSKGLMAGDLITQVNQQDVNSIADFSAIVEEAKDGGRKSVLVFVNREGVNRFMSLSLVE